MDSQETRIRRATITGALVAFSLPILALLLITLSLKSVWVGIIFGSIAALSTSLAIHFIWRPALLKKETRKRGLWFGILAGLIAFIIMSALFIAGINFYEVMSHTTTTASKLLEGLFLGTLLFMVIGFMFGGFLAIPAGALLGWYFSRNPEDNSSNI